MSEPTVPGDPSLSHEHATHAADSAAGEKGRRIQNGRPQQPPAGRAESAPAGAAGTAAATPPQSEPEQDPDRARIRAMVQKEYFLAAEPQQQREAFLQFSSDEQSKLLGELTPQQRKEFLEGLTEEEVSHVMDQEAEARLDNATAEDAKELGERANALDPDMPEAIKRNLDVLDHLIEEGKTPEGGLSNIDQIKPLLAGVGTEDAIAFLNSRGVTDANAVGALIAGLTETGETEDVDRLKNAELEATGESLDKELNRRKTFLEAEMQKKDLSEDEREQLDRYHKRVGGLLTKVTDFFAEGEAGRKYARKGGKLLYWAMLTAIILFLLEMNIIYKASARKR